MDHLCRCEECGRILPTEEHHLARRANDPEFTLETCHEDHHRYLTPWHDTAGIVPGINRLIARFAGTSQAMTLKYQRHGMNDSARRSRETDHIFSRNNPRDSSPKWARPRRVSRVTVPDPDNLVLLYETGKLIARLLDRALTDPDFPPEVRPVFMLGSDYFRAISEHPLAYLNYAATQDYSRLPTLIRKSEGWTAVRGFRSRGASWSVLRIMEEILFPEAIGFLRSLRETEKESV